MVSQSKIGEVKKEVTNGQRLSSERLELVKRDVRLFQQSFSFFFPFVVSVQWLSLREGMYWEALATGTVPVLDSIHLIVAKCHY